MEAGHSPYSIGEYMQATFSRLYTEPVDMSILWYSAYLNERNDGMGGFANIKNNL